MSEEKDNVLGHINYDFKNQKETFIPNSNFGKESKVKTAEDLSKDEKTKYVPENIKAPDEHELYRSHAMDSDICIRLLKP